MTYQQVLNDFFTIINDHNMIKTAGYGPLSEIKVPRGTYDTNYPYAFLQPTNHTLGEHQMTYRFNLIMMEMCNDDIDSVIKAQSECLQYVKDILGRLYYHYTQYDFNLNFSVVPFKEKYDDVVSGVTASVEIITRDALDDCIAPFGPIEDLLVHAYTLDQIIIDGDSSPGNNRVFTFGGIYQTDGNWMGIRYEVPESGKYKIVSDLIVTFMQPAPGEAFPGPPILNELTEGPDRNIAPDIVTGWPAAFENSTKVYNIHLEWNIEAVKNSGPGTYTWEYVRASDDLSTLESSIVQKVNSEVKIYKLYS